MRVPEGFEGAMWRSYLHALQIIDVAEINLGYTVVVRGQHETEEAVRRLLLFIPACRVIPNHEVLGDPIDVLIGCSVPELIDVLPLIRREGKVVLTCEAEEEESLDIYSTIHRNGLTVCTVNVNDGLGRNIESLSERFCRFLGRFDELYSETKDNQ